MKDLAQYKIPAEKIAELQVEGRANPLRSSSAADGQRVFDALPKAICEHFNSMVDACKEGFTDADAASETAEENAKAYADKVAAETLESANTFADKMRRDAEDYSVEWAAGVVIQAEGRANKHADDVSAEAKEEAKRYADEKTSTLGNEIKSAKGANSVYAYTLTSNEWSTKDFAAVTISPSETTSDLTLGVRGDEQLITQGNTVVFYNPDTKKQLVGECIGFLPPIDGIWDFSVRVNENLSDMTEEEFLETYTLYGIYGGAYLWKSESDLLAPAKNYTDEKTGECVAIFPQVVPVSPGYKEVELIGIENEQITGVRIVATDTALVSVGALDVSDADGNTGWFQFNLGILNEGDILLDIKTESVLKVCPDGTSEAFVPDELSEDYFSILKNVRSCVAFGEGFKAEFLVVSSAADSIRDSVLDCKRLANKDNELVLYKAQNYAYKVRKEAVSASKAYTDERVGKPTAEGKNTTEEPVNGFSKIILPSAYSLFGDGYNGYHEGNMLYLSVGNNLEDCTTKCHVWGVECDVTLIFDVINKESNLVTAINDKTGETSTVEDTWGVLQNMEQCNLLEPYLGCTYYYYTDCGTAIDDAKIHADNVSANAAANAKVYTDSAKDELKTYTDEKLMVTMKFNAKQGEEIIKLPTGYKGISKIKLWFEKADGSVADANELCAVSVHFYKSTSEITDYECELGGDFYADLDAETGKVNICLEDDTLIDSNFDDIPENLLNVMRNAQCDGIKIWQYSVPEMFNADYVVKAELTMIAPLNEKVDAVLNESKSYADEKIQKAVVDSWEVAV